MGHPVLFMKPSKCLMTLKDMIEERLFKFQGLTLSMFGNFPSFQRRCLKCQNIEKLEATFKFPR